MTGYANWRKPALSDFLTDTLPTEFWWSREVHHGHGCVHHVPFIQVTAGWSLDTVGVPQIVGWLDAAAPPGYIQATGGSTQPGVIYGVECASSVDGDGRWTNNDYWSGPFPGTTLSTSQLTRAQAMADWVINDLQPPGVTGKAVFWDEPGTGVRGVVRMKKASIVLHCLDTNTNGLDRTDLDAEWRTLTDAEVQAAIADGIENDGWRWLIPWSTRPQVYPLQSGTYYRTGALNYSDEVQIDVRTQWMRRVGNACRWVKMVEEHSLLPLNDFDEPWHALDGHAVAGSTLGVHYVMPRVNHVPAGWDTQYYVETLGGYAPETLDEYRYLLGIDTSIIDTPGLLARNIIQFPWPGGESTWSANPPMANHPFRLHAYVVPPDFPTGGFTSLEDMLATEQDGLYPQLAFIAELYPFTADDPPEAPWNEPPPPVGGSTVVSGEDEVLWTIHPKRRMSVALDQRRKRTRFRALSRNDDFRTWRKTLTFPIRVLSTVVGGVVSGICALFAGKTYTELEATSDTMTYASIPDTACTYGDLEGGG